MDETATDAPMGAMGGLQLYLDTRHPSPVISLRASTIVPQASAHKIPPLGPIAERRMESKGSVSSNGSERCRHVILTPP